jgi:hypothetical protein
VAPCEVDDLAHPAHTDAGALAEVNGAAAAGDGEIPAVGRSRVRARLAGERPGDPRPRRCGPSRIPLAIRHHSYSCSNGTTSTWQATWNTESALVYTMGRPVRTCSSPSSAMISVPEAATLPRTSLPMASSNGRMTSGGNPSGYVENGSSDDARQLPSGRSCCPFLPIAR